MRKTIYSVVLICTALMLNACGKLGNALNGEAEYPTDKATSYEKALAVVKEKLELDKVKVFSVLFMEKDELSNDLGNVLLSMVNQDNHAYSQVFGLDGTVGKISEYESLADIVNYDDVKGIDITKINPTEIEGNISEAKKLLPEKHTFKTVMYYDIKEVLPSPSELSNKGRDIGSQKTTLVVGFTEDGKEIESSAGEESIVYYKAEMTVNPDGTVSVEQ